jgi:pilus assembly protein CpaC
VRVVLMGLALTWVLAAQAPDSIPGDLARERGNRLAPATSDRESSGIATAWKKSELTLMVNKSLILDQPAGIRRISITTAEIAEAAAASAHEVLLNGKAPGDTTLFVWDTNGNRQAYELHVVANPSKIDTVRAELTKEVGPDVSLTLEDGNVFLRGTVKDAIAADRANAIASTLGKVVNLLQVTVPESEPQILLRVRFANVDRSLAQQAGFNLFTLDPYKGIGTSTTGQFGTVPTWNLSQKGSSENSIAWSLSNLLNLFYYNPEINVGAILQDLQAKNVLEILAEPNLMTLSGHPASFLAGGEFPFPTIQGGANGIGQITIQFKEFGIRLNFLPTVTPRGTIHLVVSPEVSSLDYSNGLTVNGFSIPGLSTRRVQTEVELENGQSFVIAGLLDNQVTEQLDKMPGISSIPVLGKLFQSKSLSKTKSEVLVTVTPELVRPIPAGVKPPELKTPVPFYEGLSKSSPVTAGGGANTPAPNILKATTLPVEQVRNSGTSSVQAAPAAPAPVAPPATQASNAQPVPQTPAPVPASQPNPGPNK